MAHISQHGRTKVERSQTNQLSGRQGPANATGRITAVYTRIRAVSHWPLTFPAGRWLTFTLLPRALARRSR